MFHGVLRAVITGVFFTSYFDFVTRYETYKALGTSAIINPTSFIGEYDLRGFQAIHYAVELGNLSATIALIDQWGADVNAITRIPADSGKIPKNIPPGSTPLIISIVTGNLELFHYLLSKAELNVDLGTDELKTPLHFAAENGNLEMIEALLLGGRAAKISYMKRTRKSPFHLSIEAGHLHVASWLAERNLGLGPVVKGNVFESAIHFLARQKLPATTWIGMLRIFLSIEKQKFGWASLINRKSLNGNGLTPLKVAIEEENEVAIAGLIVFGADLSEKGLFHPLIGIIRGFFEEMPIDPNYLNRLNESVWHLCARTNSVTLLQTLAAYFQHEANLRTSNLQGQSALDLAFEMQNLSVAVELIKLYKNSIELSVLERYVNISIWNSWSEIVEILIKEFPSHFDELISSESNPPNFLHVMATFCMREHPTEESKKLALVLIKNYPQMLAFHDKLGRTPLHLAIQCDSREFFYWLKEAKTENPDLNLNVLDASGISVAEALRGQGQLEILELLNLN